MKRLRPGMTSQVSIITSTSHAALTVPIQSDVERVPLSRAKKKSDAVEVTKEEPKKSEAE
jgi:hypothetical protein